MFRHPRELAQDHTAIMHQVCLTYVQRFSSLHCPVLLVLVIYSRIMKGDKGTVLWLFCILQAELKLMRNSSRESFAAWAKG